MVLFHKEPEEVRKRKMTERVDKYIEEMKIGGVGARVGLVDGHNILKAAELLELAGYNELAVKAYRRAKEIFQEMKSNEPGYISSFGSGAAFTAEETVEYTEKKIKELGGK